MRVVLNYPPNIHEIKKNFKVTHGTVFTYGDTLYSPFLAHIDPALMIHEETHQKQQGDDPDAWWTKYFKDPKFRLDQEVEAYHNQLLEVIRSAKNQDEVNKFLVKVATDLASPMYGSIVPYGEAVELIVGEKDD